MQYRGFVKTVRLIVLALILAISGNASAIIRSPFPSRPLPPFHGRYVFQGNDSSVSVPKTSKLISASR
jgi:hypothetical protein